jgi:hypothetical protein
MGLPLNDCVIVNHEKFWTVGNEFLPQTPHFREAWDEAKTVALKGRYRDAGMFIVEEARKSFSRWDGGTRSDLDGHPGQRVESKDKHFVFWCVG